MKSKTLSWNDIVSIRKLASLLKEGKIFVGPSDTVIGFYAFPSDQGFLSLNNVKKRTEKPYLLLVSGQVEVRKYVDEENFLQAEKVMTQFWPGPLTLIFKAKKSLPAYFVSLEGTIAIRVPKHEQIQRLLSEVGALFSTSANLSGQPIPETLDAVHPDIIAQIEGVLEGNNKQETTPSTIVDISSGKLKIVREGACKLSIE